MRVFNVVVDSGRGRYSGASVIGCGDILFVLQPDSRQSQTVPAYLHSHNNNDNTGTILGRPQHQPQPSPRTTFLSNTFSWITTTITTATTWPTLAGCGFWAVLGLVHPELLLRLARNLPFACSIRTAKLPMIRMVNSARLSPVCQAGMV